MTFEEAQKAIADGGEITDDVKAALSGYKPADNTEAIEAAVKLRTDSIAAAARKDAEGKATELGTQLAALQQKLDEAEAGKGTAAEQAQKQHEALVKRVEALQGDLTSERERSALAQRTSELHRIGSSLSFNKETVTDDYASHLVKQTLADVNDDDLRNAALVDPITEKLKTDNPQLFAAATASGSGGNGGGEGGAAGGSQTITEKAILDMAETGDPQKASEQLAEISKGYHAGTVKIE
jgi:hypothetical protein